MKWKSTGGLGELFYTQCQRLAQKEKVHLAGLYGHHSTLLSISNRYFECISKLENAKSTSNELNLYV